MSRLKKAFIDRMKKNYSKDPSMYTEAKTTVAHATGFDEFDYRNGTTVQIMDIETDEMIDSYYSVGIQSGSCNTIIGPSGSGKTAMVLQMACAIAGPHEDSVILHEDGERGTNSVRVRNLSGRSLKWISDHYLRRDSGITTENFYDRVKEHHDSKMDIADDLYYDTGLKDEFNQPLKEMVPTVMILDSLANLMPEKNIDEEGIGTNMAGAQVAKANANIFKKIIPLLSRANIILFIINHLNQNISINPMQQTRKQVNYLKQGETIPGGNAAIYLSNNIIKVEAGSPLKEDAMYKIPGFLSKCTIIKSRTNRAGQIFELIYTQTYGFSQPLSKLAFAKNAGAVNGTTWMTIDGYDTKFRNSDFLEKYMTEDKFRHAFDKAILPYLEELPSKGADGSILSQKSWVELLEAEGLKLDEGLKLSDLKVEAA